MGVGLGCIRLAILSQGQGRKKAFLYQRETHQARHDKDEYRQDLDKAGKQRSHACMVFIPCTQHPLHNGLVRTPVPDPDDGIPEQNGVPRHAGRVSMGAKHSQHVRRHPCSKRVPSTHLVKTDHRQNDGADQQNNRLHGLGHHHGHESTQNRIEPRQAGHHNDADHFVQPEQALHDHGAGIQRKTDVNKDGRNDG